MAWPLFLVQVTNFTVIGSPGVRKAQNKKRIVPTAMGLKSDRLPASLLVKRQPGRCNS
jgi:hypothetical protein